MRKLCKTARVWTLFLVSFHFAWAGERLRFYCLLHVLSNFTSPLAGSWMRCYCDPPLPLPAPPAPPMPPMKFRAL
jgi:hypothetical protein